MHVGRRIAVAEAQYALPRGQFAPDPGVVVVAGEHRHAVAAQGRDHLAVFARHRFHRGHEFLVFALGVVHQRDGGLGERGEIGDFAGVVHAQLDHREAVVLAQAQQRERHADVVVQIALRGMGGVASGRAQDGRHHLRHRGLAVAAGHGDQRQLELLAPQARQLTQGQPRVGHFHTRQTGLRQPRVGDGGHSALRACLRQKVVRIEALALERHEQIARLQAAGVGVHATDGRVHRAHGPSAGESDQQLGEGLHACAPCAAARCCSAACACARSENGFFTPITSW
ncbi:hypothetical protein FQZ97_677600 [compost metagenome]